MLRQSAFTASPTQKLLRKSLPLILSHVGRVSSSFVNCVSARQAKQQRKPLWVLRWWIQHIQNTYISPLFPLLSLPLSIPLSLCCCLSRGAFSLTFWSFLSQSFLSLVNRSCPIKLDSSHLYIKIYIEYSLPPPWLSPLLQTHCPFFHALFLVCPFFHALFLVSLLRELFSSALRLMSALTD